MIDVADIARIDILGLIEHDTNLKRVASTRGGEWAGPCPFCGGKDRFRVWPEARPRARFWCRGCGRQGDAAQYVSYRDEVDFVEACRRLGIADTRTSQATRIGRLGAPKSSLAGPRRLEEARDEPPPAAWRKRAEEFCTQATETLWTPEACRALDFLHRRGLADDTIRQFGLGYNPVERYDKAEAWGLTNGRHIRLPRAVTIPGWVSGELWYVQLRLPPKVGRAGKPKYSLLSGSRPALFGADSLAEHDTAIVVEGEFDAILLSQEAGDLCAVVTMGSAVFHPSGRWLKELRQAKRVIACFDTDEAGRHASAAIADALHSVEVARPPVGKDLTEAWQKGVNLREWVRMQLAGL